MALKMRKNRVGALPSECPLTECLSFLGAAWAPNVIWYLSEGPRRFSELRADIPPVSAKVLTTRLRELEEAGVVQRTVMPTSPPSVEYSLTDLGCELVPAILALVKVGQRLKSVRGADAGASDGVCGPRRVPAGTSADPS